MEATVVQIQSREGSWITDLSQWYSSTMSLGILDGIPIIHSVYTALLMCFCCCRLSLNWWHVSCRDFTANPKRECLGKHFFCLVFFLLNMNTESPHHIITAGSAQAADSEGSEGMIDSPQVCLSRIFCPPPCLPLDRKYIIVWLHLELDIACFFCDHQVVFVSSSFNEEKLWIQEASYLQLSVKPYSYGLFCYFYLW